jgi:hypothetical protein
VINLYFRIFTQIFVQIPKGLNWILRGPEETDSCKKHEVENIVSGGEDVVSTSTHRIEADSAEIIKIIRFVNEK